jgi:hypothetical protein
MGTCAWIELQLAWNTGVRRQDGHAWLIPNDPAYSPIMADSAVIIGKVVSVLLTITGSSGGGGPAGGTTVRVTSRRVPGSRWSRRPQACASRRGLR